MHAAWPIRLPQRAPQKRHATFLVLLAALLFASLLPRAVAAQCDRARLGEYSLNSLEEQRLELDNLLEAMGRKDAFVVLPSVTPRLDWPVTGYVIHPPVVIDRKELEQQVFFALLQSSTDDVDLQARKKLVEYVREIVEQTEKERIKLKGFKYCIEQVIAEKRREARVVSRERRDTRPAEEQARRAFDPRDYRSVRDWLDGRWSLHIRFPPGLIVSETDGTMSVEYIDCSGYPEVQCRFQGNARTHAERGTTWQIEDGQYNAGLVTFQVIKTETHQAPVRDMTRSETYRFSGVLSPETGRVDGGSLTYRSMLDRGFTNESPRVNVRKGGSWSAQRQ